jgi:hypothetical protein
VKKTYKSSANHLPEVISSVDRKMRCRSCDAGGRCRLRLVSLKSRRLSRGPCCQCHRVIAHPIASGTLATHRSFLQNHSHSRSRCALPLPLARSNDRPKSIATPDLLCPGNRTAARLSPYAAGPFPMWDSRSDPRRVSPTQSDCGPIRRPLLRCPLRGPLSETQARAIQDIITLALNGLYSCPEIVQGKINAFL